MGTMDEGSMLEDKGHVGSHFACYQDWFDWDIQQFLYRHICNNKNSNFIDRSLETDTTDNRYWKDDLVQLNTNLKFIPIKNIRTNHATF